MSHYCKFLMLGKERCALLHSENQRQGFQRGTDQMPLHSKQRPGHLSMMVPQLSLVCWWLSKQGVVLGPTEFYLSPEGFLCLLAWKLPRHGQMEYAVQIPVLTAGSWLRRSGLLFSDPKAQEPASDTVLMQGHHSLTYHITGSAGFTGWQILQKQVHLPPVVWAPGC